MKNINEIIKIDDLKEFFSSIGYTWYGTYYTREDSGMATAKTFSDLCNKEDFLTNFELFTEADTHYLSFRITPFSFKEYKEESDAQGSGSNYYAGKDYSKEWIKFLVKTCGEDYFNFIENKVVEDKRKYLVEYKEKLEKLQLEVKKLSEERTQKLNEIDDFKKDLVAILNENNEENLVK